MPDVFLSYSRDDKVIAKRFAQAFQREGLSVWWDATLNAGEAFDEVTEKALEEAKAVVVLWSKHSVASRWVRSEATQANSSRTLIPAMIEPCKRPIMFELTQTADLSHWQGDPRDEAWLAYLAGVKRFVERGAPSAPAQQVPALAVRATGLSGKVVAVLVAVLVISGGIAWVLMHQGTSSAPAHAVASTGTTSIAAGPASASPADSRASVAVMPFSNLTGDPGKDYLGDGMAEELINVLTKVPGLTVPSRTSSFAYKGRNTDMKQIAKDLNVRTILEGSVRSAGETIRITAQLIDAQTDRHIWSQNYDRKFTDLFKLQDDLAREIVSAFKTSMGANLPEFESQGPPTRDLEAYSLYLQGIAAAQGFSDASARKGIALLEQAVARDPGFGRAYAVLAAARRQLGAPLDEVERDAQRAIAADPRLASELPGLLADLEASHSNWVGAEDIYRALPSGQSAPQDSPHAVATWWPAGQLRRARQAMVDTYGAVPTNGAGALTIGMASAALGLDEEALAYAKVAVSQGVDPAGRRVKQLHADIAKHKGHYSEAADYMTAALPERVRSTGGSDVVKLVFAAMDDPKRKKAAVTALNGLLPTLLPQEWAVRVWAMIWYTDLGDLDAAYDVGEHLRQQFGRQNPTGAWSWLWTPDMKTFRQDPRFQAFTTRVGLMAYWQKYGPPDDCDLKSGKLACH